MRVAIVPWSVVGRLDNWSPRFVMPYVQFTNTLMSRDVVESQIRFDQVVATLSRHAQDELERLVNEVTQKGEIDLLNLSAKIRKIVFHHTRSNLFKPGEVNAFIEFAADWCHKKWLDRSEKARATADLLSDKEKDLKGKIQTAREKYEREHIEIA